MNIIAVANAAGSAGKTTTVVTLAALLAEAGQRVVVVDLDGQANATRSRMSCAGPTCRPGARQRSNWSRI